MRSPCSRTRRGAWLAAAGATMTGLAMSASLVSVTAGSARAVGPTAAPASGVTWHRLRLLHHWGPARTFGTPSWTVQRGVVYLSGGIRSGKSAEFTVLPRAERPAHNMYITVYTFDQSVGHLYFLRDGAVYAYGPGALMFTSLAGVSFPGRSVSSRKLTLQNGWVSAAGLENSGDPSYRIIGGVVYLSGSLHNGTTFTFGVLPPRARPAHAMYVTVYTYGGAAGGTLFIGQDGTLDAYGGNAPTFTSLAGISFPVASVITHRLTMLHGWSTGCCNGGHASYAVRHGIVYLAGSLFQAAAGSEIFARLPAGARPRHLLILAVYADGQTVGIVVVWPGGNLQAFSTPASNAQKYTSLAAISFPLGA